MNNLEDQFDLIFTLSEEGVYIYLIKTYYEQF